MQRSTRLRLAASAATALAAAAVAPGWAAAGRHVATPRFGAPVRVTPPNGGGYEPGIYSDGHGGLYMTAHKENAELAMSPDSRSTTGTRSMSWTWWSGDGGKTWKDLPAGPGDVYNHEFGDEGDMAFDEANNLYFVDTDVTDITLTAWHIGQNGPTFDHNNPLPGMGEPVDDRPWVTAHGNEDVFYFGNEGDKQSYSEGSQSSGPGSGPGRYTVYHSTDGGRTFDHLGITLKDSGWCRPAAAPHSRYVYAFCGNDAGTLYSFVSPNDGATWYRYRVTSYNANDGFASWPTLQVMRDGTLWASYLDGQTPHCSGGCDPTSARFLVMRSTDHGKHWKIWNATPAGPQAHWQYDYLWMSTAPNGKTLGLAVYGRPWVKGKPYQQQAAFKVYAGEFAPGGHPRLVSLDPKHPVTPAGAEAAPGDFLMCVFDPKNKLHISWTRVVTSIDEPDPVGHVASAYRDIYVANQR